jgi:hypothetical protein
MKYLRDLNNTSVVSTFDLFKGFEYKTHDRLKDVIFKHKSEFESRGELIVVSVDTTIPKKGMPETEYLLNNRQFILLCLLVKNTPNSVFIKCAIESEFSELKEKVFAFEHQKVEQLEKRLENTHKLNPNTLTAILGRDKSNAYIKEVGYGVLINAGLVFDEPETLIKHHYKLTLAGMEMALGKHSQYGITISSEHHDLLRELAREALSENQIDWTTA